MEVISDAYHGLVRERLDLLDGTRSTLLEGNTMQLHNSPLALVPDANTTISLVQALLSLLTMRSAWRDCVGRTLLCMWMVYSRATTSAMAERPCLPDFLVDDILQIDSTSLETARLAISRNVVVLT